MAETETKFNVRAEDGTAIVEVAGDLDHYNTPGFRSIISRLVEEGCTKVIVDMSEVPFMDSGGMSGIIFAIKRLSAAGGRFLLVGCSPRIARKLEIGGLAKLPGLLTLCGTIEEAMKN